jgi:hypothetical protein
MLRDSWKSTKCCPRGDPASVASNPTIVTTSAISGSRRSIGRRNSASAPLKLICPSRKLVGESVCSGWGEPSNTSATTLVAETAKILWPEAAVYAVPN